MIEHSEKLDALAPALAKAQAAVKGAVKDSTNPHFKSKYADLESIWDACRKPLTDNGLSVSQWPGREGDGAMLTTMLLHASGQWIKGTASATLTKNDAQGVGSALTYLRRYALSAVAGVAPEDDDGNAASRKPEGQPEARPAHVATTGEVVVPFGKSKGTPLTKVSGDELKAMKDWCVEKGKFADFVAQIDAEMESRRESLDQRPRLLDDTDDDKAFAGRLGGK